MGLLQCVSQDAVELYASSGTTPAAAAKSAPRLQGTSIAGNLMTEGHDHYMGGETHLLNMSDCEHDADNRVCKIHISRKVISKPSGER